MNFFRSVVIYGSGLLAFGGVEAANSHVRAETNQSIQTDPGPSKRPAPRPKKAWRISSIITDAGDGRLIDMMQGKASACIFPLPEGQELQHLFNEQTIEKRDLSKVPGAQMLPGTSVITNCEIVSKHLNLNSKVASGQTICRTTLTHEGTVHVDPGYRTVFTIKQLGPTRIVGEQFITALTLNASSTTKTHYEKCD